jgi:hypothetical protein
MRTLAERDGAEIVELDREVSVHGRTLRSGDWAFRRAGEWRPMAVTREPPWYERWDDRPLRLPLSTPAELAGRGARDSLVLGRPLGGMIETCLVVDLELRLLAAKLREPATIDGMPLAGDVRFHADGSLRDGTLARDFELRDMLLPARTYFYFESAGLRTRHLQLPGRARLFGIDVPRDASVRLTPDFEFHSWVLALEEDAHVDVVGAVLPAGSQVAVHADRSIRFTVRKPVTLAGSIAEPGRPYELAHGRVVRARDWP